jgi:hypothetical protein
MAFANGFQREWISVRGAIGCAIEDWAICAKLARIATAFAGV